MLKRLAARLIGFILIPCLLLDSGVATLSSPPLKVFYAQNPSDFTYQALSLPLATEENSAHKTASIHLSQIVTSRKHSITFDKTPLWSYAVAFITSLFGAPFMPMTVQMKDALPPEEWRAELAQNLLDAYDLDKPKAIELAPLIQKATPVRNGHLLQFQNNGVRLVEISALGTRRFFDLNGRWLLTVDPRGTIIDEFYWNSENVFESGWTWNPQRGRLLFRAENNPDLAYINEEQGLQRNANLVQVVARTPADAMHYMTFRPGLDFNDMQKIPYGVASTSISSTVDISGIGTSIFRVLSYFAQDQGHSLRYTGDDTNPRKPDAHARFHLYNVLREVAQAPKLVVHASGLSEILSEDTWDKGNRFTDIPTLFFWTPDPPEMVVYGNNLAFYIRRGAPERIYYRGYFFLRPEYWLHKYETLFGMNKMRNEIRRDPTGESLFFAGEHVATLDSEGRLLWEKYPHGLPGEDLESEVLAPAKAPLSYILAAILITPGEDPTQLNSLMPLLENVKRLCSWIGEMKSQQQQMMALATSLVSINHYGLFGEMSELTERLSILAVDYLVQSQNELLPENRKKALAVPEFFGYALTARLFDIVQNSKRIAWFDIFLSICVDPSKRLFTGQWERDYAQKLSDLSARQLQQEWERLGILRDSPQIALFLHTTVWFIDTTSHDIHPVYFGDLLLEGLHDHDLKKKMLLSIAMMNVFLEWISRHWLARSPGSAIRGIPRIVTPRLDYIRQSLQADVGISSLTSNEVHKMLELISSMTDKEIAAFLTRPPLSTEKIHISRKQIREWLPPDAISKEVDVLFKQFRNEEFDSLEEAQTTIVATYHQHKSSSRSRNNLLANIFIFIGLSTFALKALTTPVPSQDRRNLLST
jgi:hypothetical protein